MVTEAEGNGGCLKITEFLFQVLEIDSSDGYTTQWMYLMPLNCAPENG